LLPRNSNPLNCGLKMLKAKEVAFCERFKKQKFPGLLKLTTLRFPFLIA